MDPAPGAGAERFKASGTSGYYDVSTDNLLESPLVRRAAAEINRVGGTVLDIGCGRGAFASLLDPCVSYTGFDISLDPTGGGTQAPNVSWGDACRPYPYPDNSFRHVVSFWCLEHLPDPRAMLREAVRVLAPGGTLHLVFPNYDNPLRRCPSWWCDRDSATGDDSLRALVRHPRPASVLRQLRRRLGYLTRQVAKQARIDLTGTPAFEINADPAYRHLPWARDRDAIHIVSGRSVVRELRRQGLSIRYVAPDGWLVRLPFVGSFLRGEPEYSIEASKA